MVRSRRFPEAATSATPDLLASIRSLALPLRSAADLDPLMARIGHARCVLLGEATHGTHEFYTWRTELSRRLILEKGFSFIAVEGDWPDCYRVNRYVKGYAGAGSAAREVLRAFARWPTWMWANEEVADLAEWLMRYNRDRREEQKVGFYGLDVYSLWDSLYQVMDYLRRIAPEALPAARRALRCFEPYAEDAQEYARATLLVPESCQEEAVKLLGEVRQAAPEYRSDGLDAHFVAEQNALVVKNAETYYRTMVLSNAASWNVRDRHMAETLDRLLEHHGPHAKAIVWEHNTHIGDARFTDMRDAGEVNLGQLARERHGEPHVVLVGFGTHRGTVIAGREWDAPMEEMCVAVARPSSWEDVLHDAGADDKLLVFDPGPPPEGLLDWRGHRAIGVVYRPEYEWYGNYVPTVLPRRYDAFMFVDESHAVRPLHVRRREEEEEVPATFPTGA
ncbi:erythromycin esterase family protein [Sorangium sp. So ce1036]|uniref:erythromycin esterase family protein n=1 Tax=Sorangium sp. So ce1036 TaxID=3133328 RepID=UPI003F00B29B